MSVISADGIVIESMVDSRDVRQNMKLRAICPNHEGIRWIVVRGVANGFIGNFDTTDLEPGPTLLALQHLNDSPIGIDVPRVTGRANSVPYSAVECIKTNPSSHTSC